MSTAHAPLLTSRYFCVHWEGQEQSFAFKTAQPAMHWQHLYIPEVDKKAMAATIGGKERIPPACRRWWWNSNIQARGEIRQHLGLALGRLCYHSRCPVTGPGSLPETNTLQIHTPQQIYGLLSIIHNLSISNIYRVKRQQISIVSKTEAA